MDDLNSFHYFLTSTCLSVILPRSTLPSRFWAADSYQGAMSMRLGMIGLGRMGANMVRRLMRGGHECFVFDLNAESVKRLEGEGAIGAKTIEELVEKMQKPRAVWVMVPAGAPTEKTIEALSRVMIAGDAIIDGGNSHFKDDVRRAKPLAEKGVHYLDVGTSGGIWGAERGYCLMVGGEKEVFDGLEPIFKTLAPGRGEIERTLGRENVNGTAEQGYLHCGPAGSGHFVKMIHNGIEYGLMQAYAEGFDIIKHANAGMDEQETDAETTPLTDPEAYQFDINVGEVAEVWRRGSVVSSWLVDLTSSALAKSPELAEFTGRVSDSGEGRWTVLAAVEEGVPAPVITASLYQRFESRGLGEFTGRLLSAMRSEFGGHVEKPVPR